MSQTKTRGIVYSANVSDKNKGYGILLECLIKINGYGILLECLRQKQVV
jgi:hypothetical protein